MAMGGMLPVFFSLHRSLHHHSYAAVRSSSQTTVSTDATMQPPRLASSFQSNTRMQLIDYLAKVAALLLDSR